jgi:small subunit ribosomal protein S21
MTNVVLRPNESQDQLMRRFRKKVVRSGILGTIRKKRWFVSRTEERRMEAKKSARRMKMTARSYNSDR